MIWFAGAFAVLTFLFAGLTFAWERVAGKWKALYFASDAHADKMFNTACERYEQIIKLQAQLALKDQAIASLRKQLAQSGRDAA
jgi:hypothetical protein